MLLSSFVHCDWLRTNVHVHIGSSCGVYTDARPGLIVEIQRALSAKN